MTSRFALSICGVFAILATPCLADIPVPSETESSVDPVVVGGPAGASMASYRVIVRDYTGATIPSSFVLLYFTDPNLVVMQEQETGTLVDCDARTLGRVTNLAGEVVFHPRIGGYLNTADCRVRADGAHIGWVLVRTTDLDRDGVSGLQDLGLFAENLFYAPESPETDYNLDGTTGIADLSMLQNEVFAVAGATCSLIGARLEVVAP